MQLQEKKILKLIESNDEQNNKLGQLALVSILNNQNVIHWYIILDSIKDKKKINDDLSNKMNELLDWSFNKKAIESMALMLEFIQKGDSSIESIEKYFTFYNNYLFSLMSHSWPTEKRKSIKLQIPLLNARRLTTESHKDL